MNFADPERRLRVNFGEVIDPNPGLYNAGYEEGKADGYEEGKTAGFEEGKTAGYEEGETAGYDKGHKAGLDQGFLDAISKDITKEVHLGRVSLEDDTSETFFRVNLRDIRKLVFDVVDGSARFNSCSIRCDVCGIAYSYRPSGVMHLQPGRNELELPLDLVRASMSCEEDYPHSYVFGVDFSGTCEVDVYVVAGVGDYNAGYTDGYDTGYDDGHDDGYDVGYEEGLAAGGAGGKEVFIGHMESPDEYKYYEFVHEGVLGEALVFKLLNDAVEYATIYNVSIVSDDGATWEPDEGFEMQAGNPTTVYLSDEIREASSPYSISIEFEGAGLDGCVAEVDIYIK